ncbi:sugar ABC transporter ATP-binding protein [Aquitalea sp.]|uniref:sugar ABC transporter ATP-binding protein n=1 Tax=Aquitalea sp. TaxID=1872623 RepID=UPI0025866F38|nr:sugar ABC transporter ATP-binding protein [Aquitalea sp.]
MKNSSVASVVNGCKHYAGVVALDSMNFNIEKGEIRALLGKNGAGKSTLIKMLTGSEMLDSGQVYLGGKQLKGNSATLTRHAAMLGVGVVYQELSLINELTVAENLYLGTWPKRYGLVSHAAMIKMAKQDIAGLGILLDPNALVSALSIAQKQLVEIVRIMKGTPKLVILDEPTSSLSSAEVELVINAVRKIAALGTAVIYVSHRMEEIRRLAHSATIMRDGRIIRDVDIKNSSTAEIVAYMLGHQNPLALPVSSEFCGNPVLEVKNLQQGTLLQNINFTLHQGEVIGIAGLLGAGRSELLQSIVGLRPIDAGTIKLNGMEHKQPTYKKMLKNGIGYTPENRKEEGIVPMLGIDENIILTNFNLVSCYGVLQWRRIKSAVSSVMQSMSVKAKSSHESIQNLSGGNQQKVVIGRWIYADSQILLLDEPTRGVDVEAKNQIYQIIRNLAKKGKSIIVVSSEVEELSLMCDRILLLQGGVIRSEFISPINEEQLLAEMLSSPHEGKD